MTDIVKAKDYIDSFADVFVTTAIKVGENEYCKITFCRHIVENTSIPDESTPDAGTKFYLEATQSVTLPMSMAKNMAQAILNAPTVEESLVQPFQRKI